VLSYRNAIPWMLGGEDGESGLELEICWDGDEAVVHLVPASISQGGPGVVHGGYLAAIADQVMAFAAAERAGAGVVTRQMALDYLAPTPILQPVTFRAGLEEISEHRVTIALRCVADASGVVTFTGRGVYARMSSPRRAADADYDSLEERFDPSQVFAWLIAALKKSYAPAGLPAPLLVAVDVSDARPSRWMFRATPDSLDIEPGEPDTWDVRFTGNVRSLRELVYRVKTARQLADAGSATTDDPRDLLASFLDCFGR
jgi:acyl-coenzyme A thioesterase PaaI-like protein